MRPTLALALLFFTASASASPPSSDPTAPAQATTVTTGNILRRDLVRFLNASPGLFLQHVVPEPRFRAGRFYGWRLVQFFPGDARFSGVDLRAGDVVRLVNGSTVERPEQLMQVWDSLRTARELVVDVERQGVARRLRWTISD